METDEFTTYLDSLAREDPWRVDAVLKSGSLETTQRVYFTGRDGSELGPFIRKRIAVEAGLGGAYEQVMAAQRRGVRLVHLPRVVSCERMADELVVVMELVAGVTLEHAVAAARDARERLELTCSAFGDLCDAVSELHEKFDPPIIHRDLKPSNVMVSEGGVTLIDLGIARTFREGGECDTTHFGTRAYAPPEQFGFGQTDVRSDVYALGMLLFFCLSGTEPTVEVRERGFAGEDLPEPLREVIVAATQLDPARRPATVCDLRAAFDRAVEGNPAAVSAEPAAAPDTLASVGVPPAPVAPTELPVPDFSARPRRSSALSLVPGWLGLVWDVCVVGFAVIALMACVNNFLNPTPQMMRYPVWYNAVGSLVLFPLLFLVWMYLLLDRRPLRRRIPALARLTVRDELRWGAIATVVLFALFFLLTIPVAV